MGQPASHHICCSARDKDDRYVANFNAVGQFSTREEIELPLQDLLFLSFAPLWHKEGPHIRRLAVATKSEVHVYRIDGIREEGRMSVTDMPAPQLNLEHSLKLSGVTAVTFCDENYSRNLAVAYTCKGHSIVRLWSLERGMRGPGTAPWTADEGYLASLEDHQAPVNILAISPTYLFTGDLAGECGVWHKATCYQRKTLSKLHDGLADLTVDRLFLYSAGLDCALHVWRVPDLTLVYRLGVDLPKELQYTAAEVALGGHNRLARLTHLRLPLSRWAGSQGSTRTGKVPKGSIFVAGVMDDGAGVLMHWMLSEERACKSAQIAHESPIVALVYGPYDNGPLTTMDAHCTCRVWIWASGLMCTQAMEVPRPRLDAGLAVAVEPHWGLYTLFGDNKVTVFRRDPAAISM